MRPGIATMVAVATIAVTAGRDAPSAYVYVCPAGTATHEFVKGVCVAEFEPGGGRTEPGLRSENALALSSGDGRVAVAAPGAPLARVFLAAGTAWREVGVPRELSPAAEDGEQLSTTRVALAFDRRSTIHLAGELTRTQRDGSTRVDLYYTSLADRQSSWTRPVLLETRRGLFPKITVAGDGVFVTWGYRNGDLGIAWSHNRGRSWVHPSHPPADCINVSDVAVLRGTPYVVCAGFPPGGDAAATEGRNPFTGLRVYRVAPSGDLMLTASLEAFKGVWPRLFAASDGSLVLAAHVYRIHTPPSNGWDKCCAAIARSVDGGRTWTAPIDLRQLLRLEDPWTTFQMTDARLDAWDRLHVIASGSVQRDPANGSPGTDARLIHIAVDPVSGRIVSETSLTPPSDAPQGYYPQPGALAFGRAFGLALWRNGDRFNYTRIIPQWRRSATTGPAAAAAGPIVR